jgi:hypothetical protein
VDKFFILRNIRINNIFLRIAYPPPAFLQEKITYPYEYQYINMKNRFVFSSYLCNFEKLLMFLS